MKSSIHRFIILASVTLTFTNLVVAADYTWGGGSGNWNSTNWNGATAAGPTTAGNTATISSGNVTVNVGGPGNVDAITLSGGSQLNLYNGDGGIYAYGVFGNLILQGGTVNGGSATYHAYGASSLGNVTVSGSAASTITGGSFFNMNPTTTFTVADVTGNSSTDLLVSTSLRGPVNGGNDNYYDAAKLIKEGSGTMEFTAHSWFWGGLDLNGGTLKVSGGNGGYGFFSGTVNVNSGTTLSISSDGTGFGYQNGWKPSSVNIVGGTVNTTGANHVWGISGGVNMTGGTLQSGGFQWNYTNLNTNASADTATMSGPLNLRGDGGYTTMVVNVADGAAATDLLISGNITETYGPLGITKSGVGTMELSGARSYSGNTVVNAGTLVLSGANSSAASSTIVNATGTLTLLAPVLNDVAPVVIASGGQVALNFTGEDVIGSLEIAGSGPLPAGLYNADHLTYGSYFTGTGSLVIAGADSSWTSLVNGNWSTAANWSSNTVAAGYDATATFNATNGATVTLDSDKIIGKLAFDVSDYIIAGSSTLSLQGRKPTISVTADRVATISAGLVGSLGVEKIGDGTLVFSGVKSYTGGTVVVGGTLELSGSNSGNSIIGGSLHIEPGATVLIAGGDGTGFGWNNPVTTISVAGGTINAAGGSHIGFGVASSLTLDQGASIQGSWNWNGDNLFSVSTSGNFTNTISGNLNLRADAGASHSFNVSDGTATVDLQIDANLSDQWPEYQVVPASGLTKNGAGTLVLNGTNTYDGDTVVNQGVLRVSASSSLHFRPTTNGVTNTVSGSGTGSLVFLGRVDLDLSAANATAGNVWNLFDLNSFATSPNLSSITAITSTLGSFTESTPGTWELPVTNAKWVFTESNGNLSYVLTATDYDNWVSANGVTGGANDDDDSDGVRNFEEYAFGTDPTGGAEGNSIVVPLDKATGGFSYTRRLQSLTGLTYSVWYSTNLADWSVDSGATEGTASVNGSVETVPVTISSSLLSNTKLFIQVRAE